MRKDEPRYVPLCAVLLAAFIAHPCAACALIAGARSCEMTSEVCVLHVARVKSHRALACVFGKWYEGFCEATLRCAAVAGLISSSEREPLSKLRRATRKRATRSTSELVRTARPFNTCPRCAKTPCHLLTLVPHPPLNVTIVHPSQTQVQREPAKGVHPAHKHLVNSSHSFPTLPRAYRSSPELRAALRTHASPQPHHLSLSTRTGTEAHKQDISGYVLG